MKIRKAIRPAAALAIAAFWAVSLAGCDTKYEDEGGGAQSTPGLAEAGYSAGTELTEVDIFEGGRSYRTAEGTYLALSLSGSWEEMGRQYGYLAGDQLRQFHKEIATDLMERGLSQSEILEAGQEMGSTMDDQIRQLMLGVSETSDLSYDQVQELNAAMAVLASVVFSAEAQQSSCSGIAVWNEYTTDGRLIFGRNWDMDRPSMERYMDYVAVIAYNPDSGYSFADVHPLGNFYVETGINDQGLFIELNNGSQSDPGFNPEALNTAALLGRTLNRFAGVPEAAAYLESVPADASYILQVAGANQAVSVERATFGARTREGSAEGLLVAYNSFVPPFPADWEEKIPDAPVLDTRYDDLANAANSDEFFGTFDVAAMKELMSRQMGEGGAVDSGTLVQVIAVPGDLTLWFHGYDLADWQGVDLHQLFR